MGRWKRRHRKIEVDILKAGNGLLTKTLKGCRAILAAASKARVIYGKVLLAEYYICLLARLVLPANISSAEKGHL
jgi:hypothetical protein